MDKKNIDYSKEKIKENCVVEFLCSLSDKPVLSIKLLIDKYKGISVPAKASMWYTLCNILQKGI